MAAQAGVKAPPLDALPYSPFKAERETCLESIEELFNDEYSGCLMALDIADTADFAFVSKTKYSPNIYNERQMRGAEWDEPKAI